MSRGAACPDEPPTEANQYQTRCTASGPTPIQPDGTSGRASSPDVQKSPAWCMIRARGLLDDLLLFSCLAAFVTGIVIAAANLII
jgi:hypothetical protein